MAWIITRGINDGYPHNTNFYQGTVVNGWTETDSIFLPTTIWRITPGVNDGYPYNWLMIAAKSGYIQKPGYIIGYPDAWKPGGGGGAVDDDVLEGGSSIYFTSVGNVGNSNGFITMYGMSSEAVQNLGGVLWASLIDLAENDFWKNLLFVLSQSIDTGTLDVSEIIKFFISLKVFPFTFDTYRPGRDTIKFGTGFASLHLSKEVFPVLSYAREIDAGYVDIPPRWEDFRDYTDTSIVLYLPFCGSIELNPADVMGCRVKVNYLVDLTSGACVACVSVVNGFNEYPLAMVNGQCASEIPITSTNAGRIMATHLGKVTNYVSTAVNEFGNAAMQAAMVAASGAGMGTLDSYKVGDAEVFTYSEGASTSPSAYVNYGKFYNMGTDAVFSPIQGLAARATIPNMISGAAGLCGFKAPNRCYVQIKSVNFAQPSNYSHTVGNIVSAEMKIGDCSGWTVVRNVDTSTLTCSAEEQNLIKNILQSGFYA